MGIQNTWQWQWQWQCPQCGNDRLKKDKNGFFYCTVCHTQAEGFVVTAVANEDYNDHSRHDKTRVAVKAEEPLSEENDFQVIRLRYVMGLQRMIQLQCQALVKDFNVNPLICGMAGTVWLRFLAGTQVLNDDISSSEFDGSTEIEIFQQGEPAETTENLGAKCHTDSRVKYDHRAVRAWFRSLRKMIPVSYTLAVSFLVCHLAREAVLPTDIVKWSIEGKLPYFSVFHELEKDLNQFGQLSRTCPISSSLMFMPSKSVPVQKLESLAASIAESVGLDLPPVNFYAIASRYLNKLSLPVERILPHACRIYEWSMPPDLWLSKNELRHPTRLCVLSILIVAIRVLYDIQGFGYWERSLSSRDVSSSTTNHSGNMENGAGKDSESLPHTSDDLVTNLGRNFSRAHESKLDTAELLSNLEARYNEIADTEYCKDLPTYLQFCKDIAFAGSKSSIKEPSGKDAKEEKLIKSLWNFDQTVKDFDTTVEQGLHCGKSDDRKRLNDDEECTSSIPSKKQKLSDEETYHTDDQTKSCNGDDVGDSSQIGQQSEANEQVLKDEAISRIKLLKLDMEEKRFCYIPPRVNLKRFDYLHYVRKRDEGGFTYAAHADYYILLRVCAKVAEVETRCMHIVVLSFERRLAWLEKRTDHCLHLTPPSVSCEYCTTMVPENTFDEEYDLTLPI